MTLVELAKQYLDSREKASKIEALRSEVVVILSMYGGRVHCTPSPTSGAAGMLSLERNQISMSVTQFHERAERKFNPDHIQAGERVRALLIEAGELEDTMGDIAAHFLSEVERNLSDIANLIIREADSDPPSG